MTPFAQASHRAQLLRLRRLALAALPAWGLDVSEVHALTYWENATFRVDAAQGRFLLRVHRPGYRTREWILGELALLAAVGDHTDLGTQRGRPTPAGETIVAASAPGVPEARLCTLLTWVDGRFMPRRAGAPQLRALGRTIGHLHNFAFTWQPPSGWSRPSALDDFGVPAALAERHPHLFSGLTAAEVQVLEQGGVALAAMLADDQAAGRWCPVHVDLHMANVIFQGGGPDCRAVPIDFDDCCVGPPALDLSVPLSRLRRRPAQSARLQAALWEGYGSVRPAPPPLVHRAQRYGWLSAAVLPAVLAQRWDLADVRERAPELMSRVVRALRKGLELPG